LKRTTITTEKGKSPRW